MTKNKLNFIFYELPDSVEQITYIEDAGIVALQALDQQHCKVVCL